MKMKDEVKMEVKMGEVKMKEEVKMGVKSVAEQEHLPKCGCPSSSFSPPGAPPYPSSLREKFWSLGDGFWPRTREGGGPRRRAWVPGAPAGWRWRGGPSPTAPSPSPVSSAPSSSGPRLPRLEEQPAAQRPRSLCLGAAGRRAQRRQARRGRRRQRYQGVMKEQERSRLASPSPPPPSSPSSSLTIVHTSTPPRIMPTSSDYFLFMGNMKMRQTDSN
ncbi:protein PRRC2A-like [Sus scrofa]|uniref:protein PRRC2A-like n=1 Tax=Sus scrofa TaxID=9823 RepID=UPI000A2B06E3|nr:protein PRRC2A-like [Sus scrofa]